MSKALTWLQNGVGVSAAGPAVLWGWGCSHRHRQSSKGFEMSSSAGESLGWASKGGINQHQDHPQITEDIWELCLLWEMSVVLGVFLCVGICFSWLFAHQSFPGCKGQRPLKFWWNILFPGCSVWVPNPGLYCTMQNEELCPMFCSILWITTEYISIAFCSLTEPYHWL